MFAEKSTKIWVDLCVSILAHFLILAPSIYIVVLYAQADYSLFVWHPTCFTVGCALLMTEAILAISGENLLLSKSSRVNRIRVHSLLHILGMVLMTVGFGVIIANKIRNNSNHFTSDHGKLGLTAVIVAYVVALGGVSTSYSGLLSPRVSLASLKLVHGCCGIVAIILLFATLFTGLYKRSFPGSELGVSLTVSSYVVGLFIVLIKPLYTTLVRIRGIFT
ncbi:transmembrane reductase CYB561D2-like [Diprion similis]|uniref:transmembrane reductase CYB561D2-like n=1 Tax=Diprion similis TaxID=362088 RepID=UPI001EF82211|nr:transmembrane reductase CYB561D2-like [Diprion similis]